MRFLGVEVYYVVIFVAWLKPSAIFSALKNNSWYASMQAPDLPCNPSTKLAALDPSAMPESSSPIQPRNGRSLENPENGKTHVEANFKNGNVEENSVSKNNVGAAAVVRRERPTRACTQRAAVRMQAAAEAEAAMAEKERKRKTSRKRERLAARLLREDSVEEEEEEEEETCGMGEEGVKQEENGEEGGGFPSSSRLQCSKIITPLVGELEPSQLPRWNIRSMWQLASILNFLNVCGSCGEGQRNILCEILLLCC